ncbi:MAG: ATP-dependent RecD-like DNA helicase [Bacilli bacterium]|nr:ATP-dependent RecD-like DNA helicase [Bacilli bacterium]
MNYIKGTYVKNIYNNQDNGYIVGVLRIKETDLDLLESTIYFTGNFYDLRIKNNYVMYGELIYHSKYGLQFSVINYELLLPTKSEELIEFLSSDLFPIGEKTATRIVDRFGEDTLSVILDNPDSLQLIPKLPKSRIDKIHDVLSNYQYSSQIVMDLTSLGFTTKNALVIVNKYKNKAMDIVNDNIYNLIDELDFYFKDIDSIALNFGIDELDDRRVQALIIHLMNELTFETGDTYLLHEEIANGLLKYNKNVTSEILDYNLLKLNQNNRVIISDERYYLKEFYDAEEYIADKLCFYNDVTKSKYPKLNEKIKELEDDNGIKYDKVQKDAIKRAINNNLTIITGGPGTGKTTIIKAIVSLIRTLLKAKSSEIALLAPTGRAAKKMSETTSLPAYTIHKYLCWDKDKNKFNVNEHNTNPEKYIIVDEVSMLDTIVTSSLLKGIRRDVKLILVGDYYQLPSVGQGQILKDLIDSDLIDVIKLNKLYRQNEESYIPILAGEIKDKDINEGFINKKDDYNFIMCESESIIPSINYIVEKAIDKGYTDRDIQVLAPIYKSINGIDNLNHNLQRIFNPSGPNKNELKLSDVIYREGDKILQLANDTEANLSNGDIGYIINITNHTKTESKKDEMTIDFDGNIVTYTRDKFINIRHGYAISVHKSQGSEFPMVIMPIVNNYNRMLYNKLIYTAVTRAKKSLIIIGDPQCFINGVKNDYVDNRRTTLKDMIIAKYN